MRRIMTQPPGGCGSVIDSSGFPARSQLQGRPETIVEPSSQDVGEVSDELEDVELTNRQKCFTLHGGRIRQAGRSPFGRPSVDEQLRRLLADQPRLARAYRDHRALELTVQAVTLDDHG